MPKQYNLCIKVTAGELYKNMYIWRQPLLRQNSQEFNFIIIPPQIIKLNSFHRITATSSMEQVFNYIGLSLIISAGNPLELVKSRIQTMNQMIEKGAISRKYRGIIDCAKAIKVNEGMNALWKGNSITLLRFFPNEAINNYVKNVSRSQLPSSYMSNVVSGVVGGWMAAAVLYPIDTVRIMMSTSVKTSKETVIQMLHRIRREGRRFLYQGYSSSLLNIGLFRGTYYGVFDTLKQFTTNDQEKWTAAYLAGLSAGLVVYPIETIRKKKIISEKCQNYKNLVRRTFTLEGVKGFYRGCILTPIQSLTGASILMYFDSKSQTI